MLALSLVSIFLGLLHCAQAQGDPVQLMMRIPDAEDTDSNVQCHNNHVSTFARL